MTTIEQVPGIDPKAKAELQEACDRLAIGVQTSPDEKREALANLNKRREEIRKRVGVQNIAVDLVRQSRDNR